MTEKLWDNLYRRLFSAPDGTVSVYRNTSGFARGEFFIGSEVRAKTISLSAVLFFIPGIIALIFGFNMGVKNILVGKEWFEKYGKWVCVKLHKHFLKF